MAVRDDFTAGEVLAAADLNDTFGSRVPFSYGTATPTTTVDGFVWFDENSTPPEPKFWDGAAFQAVSAPGGLVHIATESFSAVSAVSINSCFSSAYQNYLIVIGPMTASTATRISFRMRASGTDSTAGYYYSFFGPTTWANSAVAGSVSSNGNNAITGLVANATVRASSIVEFVGPFDSLPTIFTEKSLDTRTDSGTVFAGGGFHNVTTSYDGFTVFPATGTITGTVRVYGYLNS